MAINIENITCPQSMFDRFNAVLNRTNKVDKIGSDAFYNCGIEALEATGFIKLTEKVAGDIARYGCADLIVTGSDRRYFLLGTLMYTVTPDVHLTLWEQMQTQAGGSTKRLIELLNAHVEEFGRG